MCVPTDIVPSHRQRCVVVDQDPHNHTDESEPCRFPILFLHHTILIPHRHFQQKSDSRNHCVPLLNVLQDPQDDDVVLLVLPLLRKYNDPLLDTIGEAIEFLHQVFQGMHLIHENHVAHR
ncbi:hypothetical protein B0H21DRAFT_321145 [Amylocystis lapponica]|nr:hypothetical protein B0H21DRAFT_321145 [Amylocystis lapponica]